MSTAKHIPVSDSKYYLEIDGIRLVYEDNELVGWYNPSKNNTL